MQQIKKEDGVLQDWATINSAILVILVFEFLLNLKDWSKTRKDSRLILDTDSRQCILLSKTIWNLHWKD